MRKYGFLTLISLFAIGCLKAETPFAISAIPDSLKLNAHAVIRLHDTRLLIANPGKCVINEHIVISVMNEAAAHLARVQMPIYSFSNLKSFAAHVIDSNGRTIKTLNKQDGHNLTGDFYALYDDDAVKIWDLNTARIPFTVEYEYELEQATCFFLPEWQPVDDEKIALQSASFKIINESKTDLKYGSYAIAPPLAAGNTLTWVLDNLTAAKQEDYMTNVAAYLPRVTPSVTDFEFYGKKGSGKSWNELGLFMNALYAGRGVLDTIGNESLRNICKSNAPAHLKAQQLYNYLQTNLHYASIQIGLGGWQPPNASQTLKKKYGDCKALAVLMQGLLAYAGISAYPVLVHAGSEVSFIDSTRPSTHFNHVILYSENPNDTFWLDCTSQENPFNYLGSFTENRPCLIITDRGGVFSHTPVYDQNVNTIVNHFDISAIDDGKCEVQGNAMFTGELQEHLRNCLALSEANKTEAQIIRSLNLSNSQVEKYRATDISKTEPRVSFSVTALNTGGIKQTANRLFLKTDVIGTGLKAPAKTERRIFPIHVAEGITQTDTIVYHCPAGYEPESFQPLDKKELKTPFGQVTREIMFDKSTNSVLLIRTFKLNKAIYPPENYTNFRSFMVKALGMFAPDLVLKKNG